jgi:hypothetical protein
LRFGEIRERNKTVFVSERRNLKAAEEQELLDRISGFRRIHHDKSRNPVN